MEIITCNEIQIDNCKIDDIYQLPSLIYYILLSVPLIGSLLNLLSLFIFIFSNNMNTKFLRYLKYYLINSLCITVNYLLVILAAIIVLGSQTKNGHKLDLDHHLISNYNFVFYSRYIFLPVWTISYTFGSLLDIMISYERILMYLPKMKFLRNMNIYVYLLIMFIISCLINLPANLSREIKAMTLNLNGTLNITVYKTGPRNFFYKDIFTGALYASTFLRDILTLIVELVISVFLVITIVKFYNKKKRVLNEDDVNSDPIIFRKTDMNNSKITLFICFFSSFNHIGVFLLLISLFFLESAYNTLYSIFGISFLLRHCLNFFILIKLNKKFKRNLIRLTPESLKLWLRKPKIKPIITTKQNTRDHNEQNEVYLGQACKKDVICFDEIIMETHL